MRSSTRINKQRVNDENVNCLNPELATKTTIAKKKDKENSKGCCSNKKMKKCKTGRIAVMPFQDRKAFGELNTNVISQNALKHL